MLNNKYFIMLLSSPITQNYLFARHLLFIYQLAMYTLACRPPLLRRIPEIAEHAETAEASEKKYVYIYR